MTKIKLLLLSLLIMASCTAKKSVIQTTKKTATSYKPIVKSNAKNQDKPKSQPKAGVRKDTLILEATSKVAVTNEIILDYISNNKGIAQSNMKNFGIPASIILGQAILESGAGTAALSVQANNHFGIKCHKDWMGETIKHNDDALAECFRKYNDASDSFKDHANLLVKGKRYASLFDLEKTDYKAWAKGLREAGYATDVNYPSKLIGIIERFELFKYDGNATENTSVSTPKIETKTIENKAINPNEYLIQKGDTLYSISKKFNITVENLQKLNNNVTILSIGQVLKVSN